MRKKYILWVFSAGFIILGIFFVWLATAPLPQEHVRFTPAPIITFDGERAYQDVLHQPPGETGHRRTIRRHALGGAESEHRAAFRGNGSVDTGAWRRAWSHAFGSFSGGV